MTWQAPICPVGAGNQKGKAEGKGYKGKGKGKGGESWGSQKGKGKGWNPQVTQTVDIQTMINNALQKLLTQPAEHQGVIKPNLLNESTNQGEARYCTTCNTRHDNPAVVRCRKRNCPGWVPLPGEEENQKRPTPTLTFGPTNKKWDNLMANKFAHLTVQDEEEEEEATKEEESPEKEDTTMEEEVNPKEEESRKEKEQQQVLAEIRARIKHLKQFPAKYTKMDLQSAEEELKSKTPCRKEKESELYAELLILNGRQEEIDKEYKRKTKENEEQLEALQQQMEALREKVEAKNKEKLLVDKLYAQQSTLNEMAIQSHKKKLEAQKIKPNEKEEQKEAPVTTPDITALATMQAYKGGFQQALVASQMPAEMQAMFSGYFDYCQQAAMKQEKKEKEKEKEKLPPDASTVAPEPAEPAKPSSSGAKREATEETEQMTDESPEEKAAKKNKTAEKTVA